jgi:hypothetical protein
VRDAQQSRKITENRARLIHLGHLDPILHDFDRALDQDIQKTCAVSLLKHQLTLREMLDWVTFESGEDRHEKMW